MMIIIQTECDAHLACNPAKEEVFLVDVLCPS
jgi:hypothetical protein